MIAILLTFINESALIKRTRVEAGEEHSIYWIEVDGSDIYQRKCYLTQRVKYSKSA